MVTFPPTPPAEEPAVVRFQAIRELTDAPDDVVMDYFPIGDIVPGGGARRWPSSLRKEAVQAIKLLCETAGLKATAITQRPWSCRGIAAGTGERLGAVARCCRRSGGRRQSLGSWGGVHGPAWNRVALHPVRAGPAVASQQLLVTEIKRNLTVFTGQHPEATIQALYLTEPSIRAAAGPARCGPPCRCRCMPDPLDGSAAADGVPAPHHGRFAGPVGLLALRAAGGPLPINFASPRQPTSGPDKTRTRVLVALAIGLLAMAAAMASSRSTALPARCQSDRRAQCPGRRSVEGRTGREAAGCGRRVHQPRGCRTR